MTQSRYRPVCWKVSSCGSSWADFPSLSATFGFIRTLRTSFSMLWRLAVFAKLSILGSMPYFLYSSVASLRALREDRPL